MKKYFMLFEYMEGFIIINQEEYDNWYHKILNMRYPCYLPLNLDCDNVNFKNIQDILDCIKIKEITEDEYKTFYKFFYDKQYDYIGYGDTQIYHLAGEYYEHHEGYYN